MAQDKVQTIRKLIEAINLTMEPNASQRQRLEAYQLCEDFKENSPNCLAYGVELVGLGHSPLTRHFGLQLLEHCVKFRWNGMSVEDKVQFKEILMNLIKEKTNHILAEESHIKDGYSRIMVEMIKREYPQQWPTLLTELHKLSETGETQTELVLFVLLRLVEDVVAFQLLQTQRRRDILQALTLNMADLFDFFVNLLQLHTTKYREMRQSEEEASDRTEALAHCQVARTVLSALAGYVDWVQVSHIVARENLLLRDLCLLLTDPELKLGAAEVLQIIVNRKGKLEDRKHLLVLFSEDAMSLLLNSARAASEGEEVKEKNYLFLKILCHVMTGLGGQLSALWGSELLVEGPATFGQYLQALLAFSKHPSQKLSQDTHPVWAAFFRHQHIGADPRLQAILGDYMEALTTTLLKVGYPSQSDSDSCKYSQLDFDSDEEFLHFFASFRCHQLDALRLASALNPQLAFTYSEKWLTLLLTAPIETGNDQTLCTLASPSFIQWDALVCYVEAVMNKVLKWEGVPVAATNNLLKAVLNYQTGDPLILSCSLSCISALIHVLTYSTELLYPVLHKLFNSVVFTLPGKDKSERSRSVQNVRRHACSLLVRICRDYPNILWMSFEMFYENVTLLKAQPQQLTQLEKSTLTEAVILISNQMKNYEKQNLFIRQLVQPVEEIWLSDSVKDALWSADKFMTFVGLDQPAQVAGQQQVSLGSNRATLAHCLLTILAVVKRCKWPKDLQEASEGGFVKSYRENGEPVMRNPSMPHFALVLENLLALAKTLNGLWLPPLLARLAPHYAKAYDLLETDKQMIIGMRQQPADVEVPTSKTPLEKMQNFFSSINENCYHALAGAAQTYGVEFYSLPGLADLLTSTIFTNLQFIPDYRLRPIIRVFMKAFVQFSPGECQEGVVVPVVASLAHYMYQRLGAKWEALHTTMPHYLPSEEDPEVSPESQEVLDDQLLRLLTREYLDLIAACCRGKTGGDSAGGMELDEEDAATEAATANPNLVAGTGLSELGHCLMRNQTACHSLLLLVHSALSWYDTTVCAKAANLSLPLIIQGLSKSLLPDAAIFLFTSILKGLQVHGQHDACQAALVTLAFQAYSAMRPRFPELVDVVLQVPGCQPEALERFDQKIQPPESTSSAKHVVDKKRKEAFKKLVIGIIEQPLGQQFRKEVVIQNLPPLHSEKTKKKTTATSLLEDHHSLEHSGLVALFQN